MQEILNVNIVNVRSGSISKRQMIRIDGQVISAIVPPGKGKSIETGTEELWAIPGLIDCHVHIFERPDEVTEDGTYRYDEGYDADQVRALRNLESALEAGITCVRDVGAYDGYNNRLRDFIEDNQPDYPYRVVSCGRHITRTDKDPPHFGDRGVVWDSTKEDLKDVVEREVELGADFIKIMNDNPIFNFDELTEIVRICRDLEIKIACHVCSPDTVKDAIRAGVDSAEHGVCFSEEFAKIALEHGTAFCPTRVAAQDSVDCLNNPTKAEMLFKAFPDCRPEDFFQWLALLDNYLPATFGYGVKIIAGTDAGTFPTGFQSLHREIVSYVAHGATELHALQTATINAAEALDIVAKVGTIEVGKSADIVLLKENPLTHLETSLKNIVLVMSRGKMIFDNRGN